MAVIVNSVGNVDGHELLLYEISNGRITAKILNIGGSIVNLYVANNDGNVIDVALAYNNYAQYADNFRNLGNLVGRFANRIYQAQFELNGTVYHLTKNNGENSLHGGGREGYSHKYWEASNDECSERKLVLLLQSPDGDAGYPGNVINKVIYEITDLDGLSIDYSARTDADTYVNMMNHIAFNLNGHQNGNILNHNLTISADYFTPFNCNLIPTGEIRFVKDTPLDFSQEKTIGRDINCEFDQLKFGNCGYDASFILRGKGMKKAAKVRSELTGLEMTVFTTSPTVLLYTGNNFTGNFIGKDSAIYQKYSGVCLETQLYPNSVNQNTFPNPLLRVGEEFRHKTIYQFGK